MITDDSNFKNNYYSNFKNHDEFLIHADSQVSLISKSFKENGQYLITKVVHVIAR